MNTTPLANTQPERATRYVIALAAIAALCGSIVTTAQTPRITLQEALALVEAGQKEAAAKNYRLSFAVVDARGDLIALGRMPGAGAGTPDTAIGKAMVAAFFGVPSAESVARQSSPAVQTMNDATGGRFRFLQGALPIVRGGVLVGAIGASGANSQQDEDSARAALTTVALK